MNTEEIYKNEKKKTEMLFKIRPTNEEQNDFILTVGNHLATENHFKTREEAEKFIRYPKWETILALVSEIMQIHESNKHDHETENNSKEKTTPGRRI